MIERKEKFPTSWLSKQQKEILTILCNNRHNISMKPHLSRSVAKRFEKEPEISYAYGHGKHEILSPIHRISMSRSMKRLKERGLVKGYYDVDFEYIFDDEANFIKSILKRKYTKEEYQDKHYLTDWQIKKKRDTWVGLTEKGVGWCKLNVEGYDAEKSMEIIEKEKREKEKREKS